MAVIAGLSPGSHRPHPLHGPDQRWPETNCSMDLWIEVLSALDLPPEAALGVAARQDFEGDQFGFTKIPHGDLEALYGLRVQELSIYRPVADHVALQGARGRLCLVEVDPFHLPDTGQAAYRRQHGKTAIGINAIDLDRGRIEYFHNGGYFALEGEDFDAILRPPLAAGQVFRPYVEHTTVDPERLEPAELRRRAEGLFEAHWARRPAENPIRRFQQAAPAQAQALVGASQQDFHDYAFNNLRMMGSNFDLLAAGLDWLAQGEDSRSAPCRAIAATASQATLSLARAVARGRLDGFAAMLDPAAEAWDSLFGASSARAAA